MEVFGIMMLIFLACIFLGIPVCFSIAASTMYAVMASDMPLTFMSQIAFVGLDSYTYLAIPLFILSGYIMETGGLSKRLVDFAASLVGNIYGGLGVITVIACAFFAAISGSSPGTVAAVGAMMIPPMVSKGYNQHFAAALTASSGSLGVLIPPSIPMILYCVTAEVSIGDMFMAGFVPGFIMTLALSATVYFISKKNGYKSDEGEFSFEKVFTTFKAAIVPLLTPIIILGGIYSGIFTATEASVVAVVYSLFASLFLTRELKASQIPGILVKAAKTAGVTVFILAFAMAFSRYLTINNIPQQIGTMVLGLSNNKYILLFLFSVLVLVTGTFLETASQVLIYTPLFLPFLKTLGVDPIHFGIVLTVGTMLGMMTPPVGINLFVAQGLSGSSIPQLTKQILPFIGVMFIIQMLLVIVPDISLFLVHLFAK